MVFQGSPTLLDVPDGQHVTLRMAVFGDRVCQISCLKPPQDFLLAEAKRCLKHLLTQGHLLATVDERNVAVLHLLMPNGKKVNVADRMAELGLGLLE